MVPIIAGLLLLWLGSTVLRQFLRANPAAVAKGVKQGGGFVILVAALIMLVRGQIEAAIGLGGLGMWLTSGQRAPDWSQVFGTRMRRSQRTSRVRSASIEMELDHESGRMTGRVLAGPFRGRLLDDLAPGESRGLYAACAAQDPEGARLLEAYLDRRFAGWREADQTERDAGRADFAGQGRSRPGAMSQDEAYELLGLAQGASREEVARAHRTLMKRFHPDHGGSTDMAARVNEAKDVLMRRHP